MSLSKDQLATLSQLVSNEVAMVSFVLNEEPLDEDEIKENEAYLKELEDIQSALAEPSKPIHAKGLHANCPDCGNDNHNYDPAANIFMGVNDDKTESFRCYLCRQIFTLPSND